jgi:hypothetical protein
MLTLLALLAGLATQFTPAQARGAAAVDVEIGAVASVSVGQRQSAQRWSAPASRHGAFGFRERSRPLPRLPMAVAPSVLQGIDRARE